MRITLYRQLCRHLQNSRTSNWDYSASAAIYACFCSIYRQKSSPYLPYHHKTHSIYVHVPKTGGNSVTKILYGEPSKNAGGHRAAWEYLNYSQSLYDQYLVFATVRHPLDRLHSAFCYLKTGGKNRRDKEWGTRVLASFKDFPSFIRGLENASFRNRVLKWIHFIPQSYFLCDAHGAPIVDTFVRIEDFEQGMQKVCRELEVPYFACHDNATPARKVRPEDYDEVAIKACYDIYRRDYELLHYPLRPARKNTVRLRFAEVSRTGC